MDDAGTMFASAAGKFADVVKQGVDQCSGSHARAHMNHHPSGLVDHHQVVILIDNTHRQIFRHGAQFALAGADGDLITGVNFQSRFVNSFRTGSDQAGTDLPLELAAAPIRHLARQKNIQPPSRVLRRYNEFESFGHSAKTTCKIRKAAPTTIALSAKLNVYQW